MADTNRLDPDAGPSSSSSSQTQQRQGQKKKSQIVEKVIAIIFGPFLG